MRRDEQQGLVLEGALGLHRDDLERVVPGVRDVLVELLVLLVGDLVFGPGPQRLHRVEGLGLDGDGLFATALPRGRPGTSLDLHPDGPGNEVGVLLDQALDLPLRGVVVQLVLGVFGLEVQGDRGSLRGVVDGFDGVGALAARFPPGGVALAGLARQQLDLVGHHERRVETDTELADQFLGGGLRSWPPLAAGAARRCPIWRACRSGPRPRRASCRCRCRGRSACARPCRRRSRCADRRCRRRGPCCGTLPAAACPARRRRSRSTPAETNPCWSRPSGPSNPAVAVPLPGTPTAQHLHS